MVFIDTDKTPASPRSPMAYRILATAHGLFYRDGIRATGVDRVIAESGVAKKTFYRHYPSKDDLVLTFLEYRHEIRCDLGVRHEVWRYKPRRQ